MMVMYGQHGTIPGYTQPAPDTKNITSGSTPIAQVTSFMYMGPARTVYLLSMVCMPAWGDLGAIKFFGRDSITAVPLRACATLTTVAFSPALSLPMVPGAFYVKGSADGVIAILDKQQADTANALWVLVYTGQYKLN